MFADSLPDPTIILRVGPVSVIRSNLMVGHAATILRRYTSGSGPSEWPVTEAKGTDLYAVRKPGRVIEFD